MGTSMSDPHVPEINRLSHKNKTFHHPQKPFQSLDNKLPPPPTPSIKRTLTQQRSLRKIYPTIRTNFISDPELNQLEKTPLFAPSYSQNYLQLPLTNQKQRRTFDSSKNTEHRQTILINEEDNYQLRPESLCPRQSWDGGSKISFLEGIQQQIKLPLDSKIKEPSENQLTFSHAVECNQISTEQINKDRQQPLTRNKVTKLMAKMIKEQKQTDDMLGRYLPKSKMSIQKNQDIKLVATRTALGKSISDQITKGEEEQQKTKYNKDNRLEVYYTNLKRKISKRKRSIPRRQQRSNSKTPSKNDYYELQKKIQVKKTTLKPKEKQQVWSQVEKRRQQRTQRGRVKLRADKHQKSGVSSYGSYEKLSIHNK